MKEEQLVNDTTIMYEYTFKPSDNYNIDLDYDPKMDVYVIGLVVYFAYIVYLKVNIIAVVV